MIEGLDLAVHIIDRERAANNSVRPTTNERYIKFAIERMGSDVGSAACDIRRSDWQTAKQEAFPHLYDERGNYEGANQ